MDFNLARTLTLSLAVIVGFTGATVGLAEEASATTVCIEDLPLGCFDANKKPTEHVRDLKDGVPPADDPVFVCADPDGASCPGGKDVCVSVFSLPYFCTDLPG